MADPIDLTFRAADADEAREMIAAIEEVRQRRRAGRRTRPKATITPLDRKRAERIEEALRAQNR